MSKERNIKMDHDEIVMRVKEALSNIRGANVCEEASLSEHKNMKCDLMTEVGNKIFIHEIKLYSNRKKDEVVKAMLATVQLMSSIDRGTLDWDDSSRIVTRLGKKYYLTKDQYKIFKYCLKRYEEKRPEVLINTMLEDLKLTTNSLHDAFKSRKAAKALFRKGGCKGLIMLNVP